MKNSLIIPTLRLCSWLETAHIFQAMEAVGGVAAMLCHDAEMPVATWFATMADTDPEEAEAIIRRGIEYMEKQKVCSCSRGKGLDNDEDGKPYCIDCGKYIDPCQ